MKFGVIGEPCIDNIHREGAEHNPPRRIGGILYSVVSLAVIAPRDEVYPVMNLGSDEYGNVCSFLNSFENIKQDYIFKVDHPTRVVNLYYKDQTVEFVCPETKMVKIQDREEDSTEPTHPIDYNSISGALGYFDAVLINMVSGTDISLDTLKKIRGSYSGYIHLDLHNVVMKTSEAGKRTPGPVENWLDWCTNSDTLQMNEIEIGVITPQNLKEYEVAEEVLSSGEQGTKALVITRGKKGVTLYRKIEKSILNEKYFELDKSDIQSIESIKFADSTGCGDVLASGFFYKNADNSRKDYFSALNYANKLAGVKVESRGVEELYKLVT
jgi:sugar/nucleoside kinase (ribokinase family)